MPDCHILVSIELILLGILEESIIYSREPHAQQCGCQLAYGHRRSISLLIVKQWRAKIQCPLEKPLPAFCSEYCYQLRTLGPTTYFLYEQCSEKIGTDAVTIPWVSIIYSMGLCHFFFPHCLSYVSFIIGGSWKTKGGAVLEDWRHCQYFCYNSGHSFGCWGSSI